MSGDKCKDSGFKQPKVAVCNATALWALVLILLIPLLSGTGETVEVAFLGSWADGSLLRPKLAGHKSLAWALGLAEHDGLHLPLASQFGPLCLIHNSHSR